MDTSSLDTQFRSQCGEDKWLSDHWDELRLPEDGFFVEVGAANGIEFSNTYWLEHAKGWRGILIEPDPRHLIMDRRNSIIERLAVGDRAVMSLGLTDDPNLSGELRTAESKNPEFRALKRIDVPCLKLDYFLNKHAVDSLDLISIDTEGTEFDVWGTINLEKWRPRIAIIELSTWGCRDVSGRIVKQMYRDNYSLFRKTKYNGIFVDAL